MDARDVLHFFWSVGVFGIAFYVGAETHDILYVLGVFSGGAWGHLIVVDFVKKVFFLKEKSK